MYKLGINYEHVLMAAKERNVSVLETLKKLKMYGITTLDVRVDRLLDDGEDRKSILCSGLNVDCVFYKGDFGHLYNIGNDISIVDFCVNNKINQIMLLTEEIKPEDDEALYYSQLKQNLRRVVKYASNFGVKVAIENFGKECSLFSTCDKVIDILKSVKGLGLVFDSGNFVLAGENPVECLNALMPYIHRVHLKDRTYTETIGSPMQTSIDGKNTYTTTLGVGDSMIKEIITETKKNYAEMDFVIEFDFAKPNIIDNIIDSATFYFTEN